MSDPLSTTNLNSTASSAAADNIIQNLYEIDSAMQTYNIEFFTDIDHVTGIIHVRKFSNPIKYSAMFTYIIFRKFQLIETKECHSLSTFLVELDQLLNMTFTNKFQSRQQNQCFIVWRNYIHSIQKILPDDVSCYVCFEDSFDSKLPCGHYICMKCLQKSATNTNLSTTIVKCGLCRRKIIRKVTSCINVSCNHRLCRFSEEMIST